MGAPAGAAGTAEAYQPLLGGTPVEALSGPPQLAAPAAAGAGVGAGVGASGVGKFDTTNVGNPMPVPGRKPVKYVHPSHVAVFREL